MMEPDIATQVLVHTDTGIHRETDRTYDTHTHTHTGLHTTGTQGDWGTETEAHKNET